MEIEIRIEVYQEADGTWSARGYYGHHHEFTWHHPTRFNAALAVLERLEEVLNETEEATGE